MDSFNIRQKQEIHVEYRDDMSQKSDASTRILTAPEDNAWRQPQEWLQSEPADAARFPPSSPTSSRSPVREKDVERGI